MQNIKNVLHLPVDFSCDSLSQNQNYLFESNNSIENKIIGNLGFGKENQAKIEDYWKKKSGQALSDTHQEKFNRVAQKNINYHKINSLRNTSKDYLYDPRNKSWKKKKMKTSQFNQNLFGLGLNITRVDKIEFLKTQVSSTNFSRKKGLMAIPSKIKSFDTNSQPIFSQKIENRKNPLQTSKSEKQVPTQFIRVSQLDSSTSLNNRISPKSKYRKNIRFNKFLLHHGSVSKKDFFRKICFGKKIGNFLPFDFSKKKYLLWYFQTFRFSTKRKKTNDKNSEKRHFPWYFQTNEKKFQKIHLPWYFQSYKKNPYQLSNYIGEPSSTPVVNDWSKVSKRSQAIFSDRKFGSQRNFLGKINHRFSYQIGSFFPRSLFSGCFFFKARMSTDQNPFRSS